MRKLYGQLARCHHQLGQRNEAAAICRAGLARYPDFAELLFLESQLLDETGNLVGAEECLQRLLQPGACFVSGDVGLLGYKARQNLGVNYRKQKRDAEAEAQWTAVLAERPGLPTRMAGPGGPLVGPGRAWRK